MRELVLSSNSELQGNAETLDGHDRDTADQRADRKVDHGVLLSVFRHNAHNHECRERSDKGDIDEERCCQQSLNLFTHVTWRRIPESRQQTGHPYLKERAK